MDNRSGYGLRLTADIYVPILGGLDPARLDARPLRSTPSDSARHSVAVLRRMSLPQRVVLVVALGLVMLATWLWYSGTLPADGWFAVAPNTQTTTDTYFVVRGRQVEHLAIPLVLIGAWAATSLWLLAPPASPEASE